MFTASHTLRRRPLRVVSAAALAAGALVVAGCGGSSSSSDAKHGAEYVPAASPMYVEFSTDLQGAQWQQMKQLAELFPSYGELEQQTTAALAQGHVSVEKEILPLLGARAGVAFTDLDSLVKAGESSSSAAQATEQKALAVIDLAPDARSDVEKLLERTGMKRGDDLSGASVFSYENGDQTVIVAVTDTSALVSSSREELAQALDAAKKGGEAALAGNGRFDEATSKLPQDNLGLFYVDTGSLVKAAVAQTPELAQLGSLQKATEGASATALVAEKDGLRLKAVGVGAQSPSQSVTPTLIKDVPANALVYVEFAGISDLVREEVATFRDAADQETVAQLDEAVGALPAMLNITLDDLAALGDGNQAVAVLPPAGPRSAEPGVVFLATVSDGPAAAKTLDTLREATPGLLQMTGQPAGATPPVTWKKVPLPGGGTAWQATISAEQKILYTVKDNLVMVATSPAALAAVMAPGKVLADNPDFVRATAGLPNDIVGLGWIDLRGLSAASNAIVSGTPPSPEAIANLKPLNGIAFWGTGGSNPTGEAFLGIGK